MKMEVKVLRCDNCGEPLGGFTLGASYCKCKYCNAINFAFDNQKVTQLDLARTDLTLFKFDDADLIYKKLIDDNGDNPELLAKCYEGRIKATLGICYIKSFTENTYKPTFTHYVPNIKSIYELDECKKLFSLKLKESVRKEYQERIEDWDKAYKNIAKQLKDKPDYDVFICTKISLKTKDNPNAEGYTKDYSEWALTIYDELIKLGYKVFLSSKCVKGGIDSDAEIFSALTKSRSLLVIGSKQEYLESAWVESEWRRWLYFIDHNQKEAKSIFLYTCGIDFKLPIIMDQKRIQKSKSSLDLINTIKGYLGESGKTILGTTIIVDREIIKIRRNKGKIDRSELISVQNIKDISNLEIDKQLDNIESDLPTPRRRNSVKILANLTESNPTYSRIIALNILVKYGFNELNDLFVINNFEKIEDLDVFKTILENGGSKDFLYSILEILYNYLKNSNNEEKILKVLNIVLPYEYSKRKELIDQLLDISFQKMHGKVFDIILSQKEFSNTQEIEELVKFADNALKNSRFELANQIANKVLDEYEEGNAKAKLISLLANHVVTNFGNLFIPDNVIKKEIIEELFDILSYLSVNERLDLLDSWNEIILSNCYSMKNDDFINFYDEFLRFYPQEINGIKVQKERIEKAAVLLQNNREYKKALHYYEYLLAVSNDLSKIYWKMMLCDLNCYNEDELYTILTSIEDNEYYNQAYNLVEHGSEFERYIQVVRKKQLDALEKNLKDKRQKEIEQKRIRRHTNTGRFFILLGIIFLLLVIVSSTLSLLNVSLFYRFYRLISILYFNEFRIEYVTIPIMGLLLIYLVIALGRASKKKRKYVMVSLSYALSILVIGGGIFCQVNLQNSSSNIAVKNDSIIKFEKFNNGYKVSQIYLTSRNAKVEIPEEYNNKPVISLESDLFKKDSMYLKEIVIPNSIESISSGALKHCYSLEKLTIPFIGNNSNDQNNQLNHIFDNISLERSTSYNLNVPASLKYVEVTNMDFINAYAFCDCEFLETIIIPEQVETIGEYAFSNCNKLKEINLPISLNKIHQYAFQDCTNLEKVKISSLDSYLKIDFGSVYANPLVFGHNLYLEENLLTNITVSENIDVLKSYAFLGYKGESITLSDNVKLVESNAFTNCELSNELLILNDQIKLNKGSLDYAKLKISLPNYSYKLVSCINELNPNINIICKDTIYTITECENVISMIGDLSNQSTIDHILIAENIYKNLTEEEKIQVSNYQTLVSARKVYNVIKYIDNIGELTLNSESLISIAETSYNQLSSIEKRKAYNYDNLVNSRNAFEVVKQINTIGKITLDSGSQISNVEESFQSLNDKVKEKVFNYQTLVSARKVYDVMVSIDNIGKAYSDYESLIAIANQKYRELKDNEKLQVSNYGNLILDDGLEYTYVGSVTDFINSIKNNLSGNYIIMRDLDFNNETISSLGTFKGTLKGYVKNGKRPTLSNFKLSSNNQQYLGLFNQLSSIGKISDLVIDNCSVSYNSDNKEWSEGGFGAFAGYSQGTINNCEVRNSTFSGYIYKNIGTGSSVKVHGGAISGWINDGSITNCNSFNNSFTATSNGGVTDGTVECNVAGITGMCFGNGLIDKCKSSGISINITVRGGKTWTFTNVIFNGRAAGIVGYNGTDAKITNCSAKSSDINNYNITIQKAESTGYTDNNSKGVIIAHNDGYSNNNLETI